MSLLTALAGAKQLKAMGALPYFGAFLVAGFLIGGGVCSWATFAGTRMYFQRATLKAENNLANFEKSLAQERLDAKAREEHIMAAAKEQHDAQIESIRGVADELRTLSAGVRVCTKVSTMRLSESATGSSPPFTSGEPRPADVVLQELAAKFARDADLNAAAYNSLMDRWVETAKPAP